MFKILQWCWTEWKCIKVHAYIDWHMKQLLTKSIIQYIYLNEALKVKIVFSYLIQYSEQMWLSQDDVNLFIWGLGIGLNLGLVSFINNHMCHSSILSTKKYRIRKFRRLTEWKVTKLDEKSFLEYQQLCLHPLHNFKNSRKTSLPS